MCLHNAGSTVQKGFKRYKQKAYACDVSSKVRPICIFVSNWLLIVQSDHSWSGGTGCSEKKAVSSPAVGRKPLTLRWLSTIVGQQLVSTSLSKGGFLIFITMSPWLSTCFHPPRSHEVANHHLYSFPVLVGNLWEGPGVGDYSFPLLVVHNREKT